MVRAVGSQSRQLGRPGGSTLSAGETENGEAGTAVLFQGGTKKFESALIQRGVLCELTFGDFEEVLAALVGRG